MERNRSTSRAGWPVQQRSCERAKEGRPLASGRPGVLAMSADAPWRGGPVAIASYSRAHLPPFGQEAHP